MLYRCATNPPFTEAVATTMEAFFAFSDAQSMMPQFSSKVARHVPYFCRVLSEDSFQGDLLAMLGIIVQRP